MRIKVGDFITVTLYDHSDMDNLKANGGVEGLLRFECTGRLLAETPLDYRIAPWIALDVEWQPIGFDINNEYISVLKSTVKSVRRLK
jgi:hypothetical protein